MYPISVGTVPEYPLLPRETLVAPEFTKPYSVGSVPASATMLPHVHHGAPTKRSRVATESRKRRKRVARPRPPVTARRVTFSRFAAHFRPLARASLPSRKGTPFPSVNNARYRAKRTMERHCCCCITSCCCRLAPSLHVSVCPVMQGFL